MIDLKKFTSKDLLEYAEFLIKESKQQEIKANQKSNYAWLMTKNIRPVSTEDDLEELRPIIQKMSSESCTAVAVNLDSLTGNLSTSQMLTTLKNLLEEQYSAQLIEGNLKQLKKYRVNKVRPLLTEGRQSTVMFVLQM